jgi:hypothetical protein
MPHSEEAVPQATFDSWPQSRIHADLSECIRKKRNTTFHHGWRDTPVSKLKNIFPLLFPFFLLKILI